MPENIHEFDDANFDAEVLKSDKPVLIDFWAEWCVPCKMIAPAVEEVANENEAVKVGKVNVDGNPGIASKYGIRSIPSLLVFRGGEVIDSIVGFLPEAELKKRVEKVIS